VLNDPAPPLKGAQQAIIFRRTLPWHGLPPEQLMSACFVEATSLILLKTKTWANAEQRRKVWLTPTTMCIAAKTRNPLKFAGVPQTTGSVSAASGPKFTILWGHVEDILALNTFFRMSIYALHSPTKLCDGAQMAIFGDFFASCFQRPAS